MPIIKKSFGKNYLQCYESEKGKTYSCEQIRKSWDNKVNYVTENSLKNTKEEAQKEFVDAFILRLLSEKKLWKIAHANIVDSAGRELIVDSCYVPIEGQALRKNLMSLSV